ncbi:WavQ, partial [Photobacterium phosphoreum]|uniref:WavQ n=1 Tax=Photobacterium phosphoreum TaxID=659 RepID=UPI000D159F68
YIINRNDYKAILRFVGNHFLSKFKKYKINKSFITPILNDVINSEDIVIYPETVLGNPLKAKNVVRWLLHKPGNFSKNIFYGQNEIYFKFDDGLVGDFKHYNSITSDFKLNIWHVPFEIYNKNNVDSKREGEAFSIRKGVNKQLIYHNKNAINIDGLTHQQIADVFKKVERFISYDSYSAYSSFAVLCGCKSIVIPDDNVSESEWYPDSDNRLGLSYGFDNLKFAEDTMNEKVALMKKKDEQQSETVKEFINIVCKYFKVK